MRELAVVLVLAGLSPLLMGMATCQGSDIPDVDPVRQNMELAKYWFENGHFMEAVGRYKAVLEARRDYYPALIGLGNSAGEASHQLYVEADDAFGGDRRDIGLRALSEADEYARLANNAFQRCMQVRTNDLVANYGFGLFLYNRSVTLRNLPYPASPEPPPDVLKFEEKAKSWRAGYKQRIDELKKSIEQFELVLNGDGGGLGTVEHLRRCKSSQAHRYLGLALFMRSDWDKRDGDVARAHLSAFAVYVVDLREAVIKLKPATSDDEKKVKEAEMRRLNQDIMELKALMRDRQSFLRAYESQLKIVSLADLKMTADQRDNRLAAVQVEISGVSELVARFDQASAEERKRDSPPKQARP